MIDFHIITVPERLEMAHMLQAQLPNAFVWNDVELKGPWFNWRQAAEAAVGDSLCVLQDDVILCRDFYMAAEQLAARGEPVSLFSTKRGGKGPRIRRMVGLSSAQGVIFPTKYIEDLLDFIDEYPDPLGVSDDTHISAWSRAREVEFLYPEPCLLGHRVDIESAIGGSQHSKCRGPSFDGTAHNFGAVD